MTVPSRPDATELLTRTGAGDEAAAAELWPLVYAELRSLAAKYLRAERRDHTLDPTGLVHEAYVRLVDQSRALWKDRPHFFRAAAQAMRRILVDHARARGADKRRGGRRQVALHETVKLSSAPALDVLALDELLGQLASLHERHAQVVELRFFSGLTIAETAAALGVSTTTVEEDWAVARAWLRRRLQDETGDAPRTG
jgi:RNA polymerase sigma-70 factor (ECF subfamily)